MPCWGFCAPLLTTLELVDPTVTVRFIKLPVAGVPTFVVVGKAIDVTMIVPAGNVPAGNVPPLPCTKGVMSRILVGVPVTTFGVSPCF